MEKGTQAGGWRLGAGGGARAFGACLRRYLTIRHPLSPIPFLWLLLIAQCLVVNAIAAEYPAVTPGYRITFPADEGSHPQYRIEWWYVTGWLEGEDGQQRGFQVTFFRHRPGIDEANPSRFAAHQLLFAHAAVSDPTIGRLLHAERSARAGFGLAGAAEGRLEVVLEDWSLRREGDRYHVRVPAADFDLELEFTATQPPLLQGREGFSQKGPAPTAASYYYSLPQLTVSGRVRLQGRDVNVRGAAWFDHEWSSALMDEEAVGWDWMGINLDDGGALMAFRMRNEQGGAHWTAATLREGGRREGDRGQGTGDSQTPAQARAEGAGSTSSPQPPASILSGSDVEWQPLRRWRSPRTGIEYPVAWRVRIAEEWFEVRPLFDDQESDSRGSTGTVYWEGAVALYDSGQRLRGRGYLELTGYGSRLRL